MANSELMVYDMPVAQIIKDNSIMDALGDEYRFDCTFTKVEFPLFEVNTKMARVSSAIHNIRVRPKIKREELLGILRENYEKHKVIVAEAKEGYMKAAMEAANDIIEDLKDGKMVDIMSHRIDIPADYTKVYEHTIRALELTTEEVIELSMDEFSKLVMDEWDWQENFLKMSSDYSPSGRAYYTNKYE